MPRLEGKPCTPQHLRLTYQLTTVEYRKMFGLNTKGSQTKTNKQTTRELTRGLTVSWLVSWLGLIRSNK